MTPVSERRLYDVSVVVACRDDEERIGHLLRKVAAHLGALGVRHEILVVDEGSSDDTLPLLALVQHGLPDVEIVAGAERGHGLERGAQRARGRALVLLDARSEPPLSAISWALARVDAGADVVPLAGRCLVVRRARCWRAFDALVHHRDPSGVERRFLRRARSLDLAVSLPPRRSVAPVSLWQRLRQRVLSPLAI